MAAASSNAKAVPWSACLGGDQHLNTEHTVTAVVCLAAVHFMCTSPVTLLSCSTCVQEGRSQWSPVQPITTAASLPGCPVGLKLGQITRTAVSLSWSPPNDDGGSPVQSFEVGSNCAGTYVHGLTVHIFHMKQLACSGLYQHLDDALPDIILRWVCFVLRVSPWCVAGAAAAHQQGCCC